MLPIIPKTPNLYNKTHPYLKNTLKPNKAHQGLSPCLPLIYPLALKSVALLRDKRFSEALTIMGVNLYLIN